MKHMHSAARGRLSIATLALSGAFLLLAGPALAQQDCGVLSTSKGNVVGSLAGAAAGGLIGNQFGHGKGQGAMTGLGVVGGALAGGYVGRQVEGCGNQPAAAQPQARPTAARPAAMPANAGVGQSCRYFATQAVIDGREQPLNAIACQGPDGSWNTASGPAAERAAETDLVLRAQQSLRDQGFYVKNNIDGQWGPATSGAVRNFQRAKGLVASGQLDPQTQQALGVAPAPLMAQATPAGVPVQPAPMQAQPVAAPGMTTR